MSRNAKDRVDAATAVRTLRAYPLSSDTRPKTSTSMEFLSGEEWCLPLAKLGTGTANIDDVVNSPIRTPARAHIEDT